jgi:hypothetical protein
MGERAGDKLQEGLEAVLAENVSGGGVNGYLTRRRTAESLKWEALALFDAMKVDAQVWGGNSGEEMRTIMMKMGVMGGAKEMEGRTWKGVYGGTMQTKMWDMVVEAKAPWQGCKRGANLSEAEGHQVFYQLGGAHAWEEVLNLASEDGGVGSTGGALRCRVRRWVTVMAKPAPGVAITKTSIEKAYHFWCLELAEKHWEWKVAERDVVEVEKKIRRKRWEKKGKGGKKFSADEEESGSEVSAEGEGEQQEGVRRPVAPEQQEEGLRWPVAAERQREVEQSGMQAAQEDVRRPVAPEQDAGSLSWGRPFDSANVPAPTPSEVEWGTRGSQEWEQPSSTKYVLTRGSRWGRTPESMQEWIELRKAMKEEEDAEIESRENTREKEGMGGGKGGEEEEGVTEEEKPKEREETKRKVPSRDEKAKEREEKWVEKELRRRKRNVLKAERDTRERKIVQLSYRIKRSRPEEVEGGGEELAEMEHKKQRLMRQQEKCTKTLEEESSESSEIEEEETGGNEEESVRSKEERGERTEPGEEAEQAGMGGAAGGEGGEDGSEEEMDMDGRDEQAFGMEEACMEEEEADARMEVNMEEEEATARAGGNYWSRWRVEEQHRWQEAHDRWTGGGGEGREPSGVGTPGEGSTSGWMTREDEERCREYERGAGEREPHTGAAAGAAAGVGGWVPREEYKGPGKGAGRPPVWKEWYAEPKPYRGTRAGSGAAWRGQTWRGDYGRGSVRNHWQQYGV